MIFVRGDFPQPHLCADPHAGATYPLTKDFDFGNQDHRVRVVFSGRLDGDHHTISNIRLDLPAETYVGLLNNPHPGGGVRKLAITDSYFRAHGIVAPFAGAMQWGGFVEECYSQGNEIISVSTNGQPSGGIVGGGSYERPVAVVRNSCAGTIG